MAFSSQRSGCLSAHWKCRDHLDEYINNSSSKEKNKVIGQRSVTLHIEDFRNDFSFVQPMLKMLH